MNIQIDTTYLMPSIGVSVRGVSPDIVISLREKGHNISINELTLFELSAKGAKHVSLGELNPDRLIRGIQAVARDEHLNKNLFTNPDALRMSFKLRDLIADYLDCIILSTAICKCNALMTEDHLIQELKNNERYRDVVDETNPEFQILSRRDITKL